MRYYRMRFGRIGVALVVAYMLVLQSLVGAFALGAATASPVLLDAFGNPLCITSSLGAETDADHSSMPDCCTITCSMFAPVTAEERVPHSLYNPQPQIVLVLRSAFESSVVSFSLERGPGNPRAPPELFA